MKPLWIRNVSGLYQEFFQPDTKGMASPVNSIDNAVLDAGMIFWRSLFVPERIRALVDILERNVLSEAYQIPQFLAVVADKESFILRCITYSLSVCDTCDTDRGFFKKLETISILCRLYSEFEFYPFNLTIQNGFVLDEISSREIARHCLNPRRNPYYSFIKSNVIELVAEYNPSIIFLCGKLGYFSFSTAMMIRKVLPGAQIIVTRHSSEYYSLNKITRYLKCNENLFEIFNGIILQEFDKSESDIVDKAGKGKNFSDIPHVISSENYSSYSMQANWIAADSTRYVVASRKAHLEHTDIKPNQIYDVHIDPYVKCYWNKCVFCGINKKYLHNDAHAVINSKMLTLCEELPCGAFLWFIDEAIHPKKLSIIADMFISAGKSFIWQARCRIDRDLLEQGLPEKLAKSGLRELRLGLESASSRVLALMNKFEPEFDIGILHEIISAYSGSNISIHFPIIVGFPGETVRDRQITYEFINTVTSIYSSVTFNINIFNFDVSSPLFKNWDQYQISTVSFPCHPSDFIGNLVEWGDPFKESDSTLERERNSFMRTKLYDWMPANSFISPVLFYRLSETIRSTLIWKSKIYHRLITPIEPESVLKTSPSVVVIRIKGGDYVVYNWDTHHYAKGGEALACIIEEWRDAKSVFSGINNIKNKLDSTESHDEIFIYIRKLQSHGHLLVVSN